MRFVALLIVLPGCLQPAPPPQPVVWLEFRGATNLRISDYPPLTFGPLDSTDFGFPGQSAWLQRQIVARVRSIFAGTNIVIQASNEQRDPPPLPLPVYFGGFSMNYLGLTSGSAAIVYTEDVALFLPWLDLPRLAVMIGNIAAHEAGHLLGLNDDEIPGSIMRSTSPFPELLADDELDPAALAALEP